MPNTLKDNSMSETDLSSDLSDEKISKGIIPRNPFLAKLLRFLGVKIDKVKICKNARLRLKQIRLAARKQFWEALKAKGLSEKNSRELPYKTMNEFMSMGMEAQGEELAAQAALEPIPLTDDLLRLIKESGIHIKYYEDCTDPDDSTGDEIIMLKIPNGRLIKMVIYGKIEENYSFSLYQMENNK